MNSTAATLTPTAIRILFIEDSEFDHELLLSHLERAGFDVSGERVEEAGPMKTLLAEREWDAVISDHNLPRFSSFGALKVLKESGKDLPFIVVSGESGEELAVETMIAGADDYIIKGRLKRLAPALRRSLEAAKARRERSEAATALTASETRLRELTKHLESAKEEERAAIAREVHDDIGGAITAIKFELAWIRRHGKLEGDAFRRLESAISLSDGAADTTQKVVLNLRPAVLDQGIIPALEWITRQTANRSGMEVSFSVNKDDIHISAGACNTIYRVCQEALTNVIKHANATKVNVDLFMDDSGIYLEIADNGKGFGDIDLAKTDSFGITGMKERARAGAGSLEVTGAGGHGTTVMLTLPPTSVPRETGISL